MATKRQKKQAYKAAKKTAKKYLVLVLILVLLIIGLAVGGFILYKNGYFDKWLNKSDTSNNTKPENTNIVYNEDGINENIVYDNFQIHFLELGNEYAGDSVYIKAGDNDILIDAGSRKGSATTIKNYVDKYCTDGKLEYVIATHAHQDHIAGFVGTSNSGNRTGILYQYKIGTLIDFALSDVTSELYKTDYLQAVSYAVSNGATHHKADWYFDSSRNPLDTAYISLGDNISMDILYNKYYFEKSSDENNYSVCTMFNYIDKHFIMTGDLEKEGEESLANYYDGSTPKKTLPKVELFKAGHHGSKTSSNECLLSIIQPRISVACCCAGSTEYTLSNDTIFPTQDFINRIAKYTSRVYITSLFNQESGSFESMNGNVIVSTDGTSVGLKATNNLTRLKDTAWFNEKIYLVDGKVAKGSKGSKDFYKSTDENVVEKPRRTWPSN